MYSRKRKAPRHLEKMLFVNHREDLLLQERLEALNLEANMRMMELERERITVKDELRLSRKKNVSVNEDTSMSPKTHEKPKHLVPAFDIQEPEKEESQTQDDRIKDGESDTVNAYLLGEFRRVSEVIPSILLTLSMKDDKGTANAEDEKSSQTVLDPQHHEPDIARITCLVRSVKKLRREMAANKKIELFRSKTSLNDLLKNVAENKETFDEYTDGTCVLLRRKIDKRRRDSSIPAVDVSSIAQGSCPPSIQIPNRVSTAASDTVSEYLHRKRHSVSLPSGEQSVPVQFPPLMARCLTTLGFSHPSRQSEVDSSSSQMMDEDDMLARKRIAREHSRFDRIREKVDNFMLPTKQKLPSTIIELSDDIKS